MLEKIISGGQTGVDQLALKLARANGFLTGGTAAKGWKTETGPAPWLADYGLVECEKEGYPARTIQNVIDADATAIIDPAQSGGSDMTKQYCLDNKKHFLLNPNSFQLADWIVDSNIKILNIAGNRASKLHAIDVSIITMTLIGALEIINAYKAQAKTLKK